MEISEIKNRLTLAQVLHHYGLKPDKNGMLKCPFHADKTPSMKIYSETHTAYCFSSNCQTHGKSIDVIDFVMYSEQLSKHEAILKAKSMISQNGYSPNNNLRAVLSHAWHYFQSSLPYSADAIQYLQSRGLDYEKIRQQVGYNGKKLHHPQKCPKGWKHEAYKQSLEEVGLIKPLLTRGHRPWAGRCLIFPLRNEGGEIVSFYGRAITDRENSKHFYLQQRSGLFPGYPAEDATRLILTESVIDALSLMYAGIEEAVLALYGTHGLSSEHIQAIQGMKYLEEIIFFLDGDEAGRKAVATHSQRLHELLPQVAISTVATPEGEDPNSLLMGHEPEVLRHLLEERKQVSFSSIEPPFPISSGQASEREKAMEQPEVPEPASSAEVATGLDSSDPERLGYTTQELRFTIWGGISLQQLNRLKVNLHIECEHRNFREDVNLYSHRQRKGFVQAACEALEYPSHKLKAVLDELTTVLEAYRLELRDKQAHALKPKQVTLSAEERQEALTLLRDPQLVANTQALIAQSGVVGEETNRLLLFFLYLSRLFDDPLHAIIFGKSGSGKTYLQTKISELLPGESVRSITSLSENTLYYSPPGFWEHVVLVIEDLEGVYQAFLPLRELMSKQSISKLTTDKDAQGNHVQKVLTV